MRVNVRLISSVRVAPSRGLDSELLFIYLSCINDDLEGRRIEIRNSLLSSNGPVISKMRPFIAAVLESESSTPNVCAKWRDIYNIWNLPLNATHLWVSCPWWLQSSLFLFLIGCTPCQELAKRRKWKVHGTPNGSATKSSTNENVWWKSENTDTRRTNTYCFWLCFGFCMVMTTTKKIKIKIKRRTCNSYFSWPFARPVQYGLLDGFHVPVMTAFLYTEHGPIYIILHDEIKLTKSSIPSAENCFAAEQRWCVQVCNDNTRPNCA